MSSLGIGAVVAALVWLGVLSFVTLLLVRQVGILTAVLNDRAAGTVTAEDGPLIGEEIAESAIAAVPDLRGDLRYVLMLDDACDACRMLVSEMRVSRSVEVLREGPPVIALVAGKGPQAAAIASMLPDWIVAVTDPAASQVMESFGAETTPAAYQLEHGRVTGRAVLVATVQHLVNFVRARQHSDAAEFAGAPASRDGGAPAVTVQNGASE